jgi:hypothetical protein
MENCVRRLLHVRGPFIAMLLVAMGGAFVERTHAQQTSPGEILDRYCKLTAEGKQLIAAGAKELAPLVVELSSSTTYPEIIVIKDYSVSELVAEGKTVQVAVDYNVWGMLESSSLRFVTIGGVLANRPTRIPEYVTLIQLNRGFEPGPEAQAHDGATPVEWKISKAPSEPHISVSAAIQYTRELGYKSKDPIVRANAQRTLADLQRLDQVQLLPAPESPQQSASSILLQFAALESAGKGLTADGVKQLQDFFIDPSAWQPRKIRVARDFVVSNSDFIGNRGALFVEYMVLGDLDSSLRFTSEAPTKSKVREDYTLVLSNKYFLRGGHGEPAQEIIGPRRWKIEDSTREQWISVNAAINYVTDMRDKTTDPAVQQNANQTLAKLMSLR